VPARLLAAAVGKCLSIGGYDIEKHQERPIRRFVPPGTVYYFETDMAITDVIKPSAAILLPVPRVSALLSWAPARTFKPLRDLFRRKTTMFTDSILSLYRAVTPLHCGGGEGGGVDLPVVRERFTQFPIIPASSLKGVWRDVCKDKWEAAEVEAAFGPAPDDLDKEDAADEGAMPTPRRYAGCLGFVDAQLLFLPVRSSRGGFALITCPLQIRRFLEARSLSGHPAVELPPALATPGENGIIDLSGGGMFGKASEKIYLEDVTLTISTGSADMTEEWLPQLKQRLSDRAAVVADDTFKWFAVNAMEVVAHNKLDDDTKQSENLWYEEAVPAESIFFALLLRGPSHRPKAKGEKEASDETDYLKKIVETDARFFQVGGHETTGRGIMDITHLNSF
jgi:CRISPR-associated protein Cmr4